MEKEMWPWETGAADWARRRRKNKNARSKPTIEVERDPRDRRESKIRSSAVQGGGGAAMDKSPFPIQNNHSNVKIVSGQKKRRAAGKFDKLVETRKELQASMTRVNEAAELWEIDNKLLDDRASAIGGEGAVIGDIGKALGETEELRQRESLMLGDLAVWLERIRDMPREMIELEIEDSLQDRLEIMQETANGFSDSNDARAAALKKAIDKFTEQSSQERNLAKKANIIANESQLQLSEAVELATNKTLEASTLATDLLSCKERHTELLKNHKTFVNNSKAEAERTANENEDILRAKDMRIAQLESKLRNVEQLGRALMGDEDLVDRLEALEKETVEREFEMIGLKRTVVERDVTISTLRLESQQLKNELDRSGGAENGKLREKVEKLTNDNKVAMTRINDLESAESELQTIVNQLKDSNRKLDSEKQSLIHEKEKLQEQINKLKKNSEKIYKLEKEIDELKNQLKASKKDNETLSTRLTNEFEEKMKEMKAEIISLKDQIKSLNGNIEDLTKQMNDKDNEIENLKSQLEEKENQLIECQNKLKDAEQITSDLRAEMVTLKESFDTSDLEAKLGEKDKQIEELERNMSEMQAHVSRLEAQIEDTSQLDAKTKLLDEANERIKVLERELFDTKNALDVATKEGGNTEQLTQQLKMAQLKVEELKNEVARLMRINAKFTAQLEETQKRAQDLTAENGKLRNQLGELKTILAHTVKMTKQMDPKAVRNKDTRASLTNMVVQYDKFEEKEKNKSNLKQQFIKRMSMNESDLTSDMDEPPEVKDIVREASVTEEHNEEEAESENESKEESEEEAESDVEFVEVEVGVVEEEDKSAVNVVEEEKKEVVVDEVKDDDVEVENEIENEVDNEVENEVEEKEIVKKVKKVKKPKKEKVKKQEVKVVEVEEEDIEVEEEDIEVATDEVEEMDAQEVEIEEMPLSDPPSEDTPTLDLDIQNTPTKKIEKSKSLKNIFKVASELEANDDEGEEEEEEDQEDFDDGFKSPVSKLQSFKAISEAHSLPVTKDMVVTSKYDPSKFSGQPSPRLEVLIDIEDDTENAIKTAEEIEDRLEALKERYYLLSGSWLDAKLDASKLTRGTIALAKEYEWRVKGRPIETIGASLMDATKNVGQADSLREVSYSIARLRTIEEDISDRISWAIVHPPCRVPGCKNKAVLIAGSDSPSICTFCKAEQKLLKATGHRSPSIKVDTDLEQLERLRKDALRQEAVLTDCLGMFDVESAAALRRQVEKEAEQLNVLLSWRSLIKAQRSSQTIGVDQAEQEHGVERSIRRLHIIETQIIVLSDFIETSGGWKAAVVIGQGYVNVDAKTEYWNVDEKVGMLNEMVTYLKSNLESEHEDKISIIEKNDVKVSSLENDIKTKQLKIEELELELLASQKQVAPPIIQVEEPLDVDQKVAKLKLQLERQTGIAQGLQAALEKFMFDLKPELDTPISNSGIASVKQDMKSRRRSMLSNGSDGDVSDDEEDDEDIDGLFGDDDVKYPNYDVSYVRKNHTKVKTEKKDADPDETKEDLSVINDDEDEVEIEDDAWLLRRAALVAAGETEAVISLEKSLYLLETDGEKVYDKMKEISENAKQKAKALELELSIMTDACIAAKKQIDTLEKLYRSSLCANSNSKQNSKNNSRQSTANSKKIGGKEGGPIPQLLYHDIRGVDSVGGVSGMRGPLTPGASGDFGVGGVDGGNSAAETIIAGLKAEVADRDHDIRRYLAQLKLFGIPDQLDFAAPKSAGVGSGTLLSTNDTKQVDPIPNITASSSSPAVVVEDNEATLATTKPTIDNTTTEATTTGQSKRASFSDKVTNPIGCLEELEKLVVHDKSVVELLNSLLFQKIEINLKLNMTRKKLTALSNIARTAAASRPLTTSSSKSGKDDSASGEGGLMISGNMLSIKKPSFNGKKSFKQGNKNGNGNDGNDEDDEDEDDEFEELEKTMLALHHYIKTCEKEESRIIERIEEVQGEHNRCGQTLKERFHRVELCTQWIFSGMSHRLFLEWGRQWKEDLDLAHKTRKEMHLLLLEQNNKQNMKGNGATTSGSGKNNGSRNQSGYNSKNSSIPGTPNGGAGRLGENSGLAALFHAGGVYTSSSTPKLPSDLGDDGYGESEEYEDGIMINPFPSSGRMKVRTPSRTPPLGLLGYDLGTMKMGVLRDIETLRGTGGGNGGGKTNPYAGSGGNSRHESRGGSRVGSNAASRSNSRPSSKEGGQRGERTNHNNESTNSRLKHSLSLNIENDNNIKDSRPNSAHVKQLLDSMNRQQNNHDEMALNYPFDGSAEMNNQLFQDGEWTDPDGWITIAKKNNKQNNSLSNHQLNQNGQGNENGFNSKKFVTDSTGNFADVFGSSWAINKQPKKNESEQKKNINEHVSFPKIKGPNHETGGKFPWRPENIKPNKDSVLFLPSKKYSTGDTASISPSSYFRKLDKDKNHLASIQSHDTDNDSQTLGSSIDLAEGSVGGGGGGNIGGMMGGLRLNKQSLSSAGGVWSAKMDPTPVNKRSQKPAPVIKYI